MNTNARTRSIGGIAMQYPVMLGAGVCKRVPDLHDFLRDDIPVGARVLGSIEPEPSEGNSGTLFYPESYNDFLREKVAVNSFGMPNDGYDETVRKLMFIDPKWNIIVSVAAKTPAGFVDGVKKFDAHPNTVGTKANLSCPNKKDQPIPIAYDYGFVEEICEGIAAVGVEKPVWFKMPPPITPDVKAMLQRHYPHIDFSATPTIPYEQLVRILHLIGRYPFIKAIVQGNTIGSVIIKGTNGKPVTTPNGGRAGLSGPILKKIALDFLKRERRILPRVTSIIAQGGAVSGDDAADYLEVADAVGAVTGPFFQGARFFSDLLRSDRLVNRLTHDNP
ncbi:MAG TPA: hypothetical protein VF803_01135 [Candidatus Paceibacterota bacterium]